MVDVIAVLSTNKDSVLELNHILLEILYPEVKEDLNYGDCLLQFESEFLPQNCIIIDYDEPF